MHHVSSSPVPWRDLLRFLLSHPLRSRVPTLTSAIVIWAGVAMLGVQRVGVGAGGVGHTCVL